MARRPAIVERLSLRVRLLLFFAALLVGGWVALGAGVMLALRQAGEGAAQVQPALLTAALVAGFGLSGLIVWVWFLFDENVARAIERLANGMRARAHADVARGIDTAPGRYLGDLAPAADAVAQTLAEARNALVERVARETAELSALNTRLEEVLADLPAGVVLCSADHAIVLYNAAAGALLDGATPPGLGRSIFDHLDEATLRAALNRPDPEGAGAFDCPVAGGGRALSLRIRPRADAEGAGGHVLLLAPPAGGRVAQGRGVEHDFDLAARPRSPALLESRLEDLTYVVFDTETTGLLPSEGDEIVQLAALRIVGGRVRAREVFDMLVNPGRPIPAAATEVHGITAEMVADAPPIAEVARRFHAFAQGAVLVAHNAPFDMEFLRRHEGAIGARFDHPVLDTVLLSAVAFGQLEGHSLDALTDRLGIEIPPEERHTAIGDTRATAAAFLALLRMIRARGIVTFGDALAEVRRHGRLLKDLNG
ncbi:MAG: exonuclease domain-containing protein [Gemmobacter sp.]